MELLSNIGNDTALLYAVVTFLLAVVAIIALRVVKKKTGLPTEDLEAPLINIKEQAKAEIVEGVQRHTARDPKTGKFVSLKQKTMPANKKQPDTPKTVPKEDKEEESEPAKRKRKLHLLVMLFLLPLVSCSLLDAGFKYAKDNVQITWKGDEASDNKPIDSIVVKSEPVYWKENSNSFLVDTLETETEFYKDGYRVWCLTTPTVKRYEVQRKDTVIYIYKK